MPEEEPKIGALFMWLLFLFKNIIFIVFIIFNIKLIKNYNGIFSHEILYITTVFSCMIFFYFFMIISKIFFVDFIFFNIKLVKNLVL